MEFKKIPKLLEFAALTPLLIRFLVVMLDLLSGAKLPAH